jgi:phytol kinase
MSTLDRSRVVAEQFLDKSSVRLPSALRHEILRKCIHLLVAFVPSLAAFNPMVAMGLLAAGTLLYVFAEQARQRGLSVFVISEITVLASRDRDRGHFVLSPVTLGVGAMLALILYPLPASSVAIYALAFGDGFASLAGKVFGTTRIPLSGGKTIQGSLTCFIAVFVVTVGITGSVGRSAAVAGAATLLEALPTGDFDNIVLPVGTGLAALLLLPAAGVPPLVL